MQRLLAIITLTASLISGGFSLPQRTEAQTTPACYPFGRNLSLGSSSPDVKELQRLLNSLGFQVSVSGMGSRGMESSYFGAKTRIALSLFQKAKGISPASGYFGPLTRQAIQTLCLTSYATQGATSSGTGTATSPSVPAIFDPLKAASSAPTPPTLPATAPASAINPRSIVGILCTFRNGNQIQLMKGSGVIVNQQGFVLTARHLVDPKWTLAAYNDTLTPEQRAVYMNSSLDHCEVGLPGSATLPSPQEIRAYNPSILITRNFQYKADVFFLPSRDGLSEMEYNVLDFAVLKINSSTGSCSYFNPTCDEFGRFPYTPATTTLPVISSEEVLSYGYPSETGVNHEGDLFYNFYLKGAAGTVSNYLTGNQKFQGEPLNFAFSANDIQGGRSGSPLFLKGKVIGILYGSTSTQESYNLAMTAILKLLKEAGYGWVLATE